MERIRDGHTHSSLEYLTLAGDDDDASARQLALCWANLRPLKPRAGVGDQKALKKTSSVLSMRSPNKEKAGSPRKSLFSPSSPGSPGSVEVGFPAIAAEAPKADAAALPQAKWSLFGGEAAVAPEPVVWGGEGWVWPWWDEGASQTWPQWEAKVREKGGNLLTLSEARQVPCRAPSSA